MFKITREMLESLPLDRYDVCEVYYMIDLEYGSGGSVMIWERPSTHSRYHPYSTTKRYNTMSIGMQFHYMKFRPSPMLESYFDLTHDQRIYYKYLVQSWGLP